MVFRVLGLGLGVWGVKFTSGFRACLLFSGFVLRAVSV